MVALQDVCISISDGDHNAPPKTINVDSVPFVTISDMQPEYGDFDYSGASRVPVAYYDRLAEIRKPKKGDVVYSVVGSFGIPILVKNNDPFVFQRHIAILRPNNDLILSEYLYYLMRSRPFFAWADSAAIGAAQRTITLSALRNKQITLPSLEDQANIVTKLRPYDSLIENNRKQIKLLEEAAQRLYKEWFIDLRFPGHETANINPETGLPEDWTESPLACLLEAQIGGGWGEETLSAEFSEMAYVIRATDIGDVENGSLSNIPLRCHKPSNLASRALRDGDIIFEVSGGSRDHGVGRNLRVTESLLSQLPFPVMCASFCKKLRPKSEELSLLVAESIRYAYLTEGLRVFEKRSAGNIINFHWDEFLDSFVLKIPPANLLETFLKMVDSIHKSKMLKASEMKLAREARDRLLPKLMSGELEV